MSVFHEVSIYKPDGQLKEVITQKQLEKRHWEKFMHQEAKYLDKGSFLKPESTVKFDTNLREL
jgi:hypothetical protein